MHVRSLVKPLLISSFCLRLLLPVGVNLIWIYLLIRVFLIQTLQETPIRRQYLILLWACTRCLLEYIFALLFRFRRLSWLVFESPCVLQVCSWTRSLSVPLRFKFAWNRSSVHTAFTIAFQDFSPILVLLETHVSLWGKLVLEQFLLAVYTWW